MAELGADLGELSLMLETGRPRALRTPRQAERRQQVPRELRQARSCAYPARDATAERAGAAGGEEHADVDERVDPLRRQAARACLVREGDRANDVEARRADREHPEVRVGLAAAR